MPDVMGANPLEPVRVCCPACRGEVLEVYVGRGQPVLVELAEQVDPVPGLYVAVAFNGRARSVRLPADDVAGEAIHIPHETRCQP
jgi:hypothetical protein